MNVNVFRRSRRLSDVATAPLLGMILALALAILPLAEKIATWVLVGFFVICAIRLFLNHPGARLPSLPIKLLLFAGGVGGVIKTYGTPLGIEPGFSILAVLVSLKMIEANGPRDFHVLALLGFFLSLCDLFSSQDLIRWIYVAAILVLLLATLIRFHRGENAASYPRSAALAGTLLVQALPIAVLLFVFFPRVYGGFRFQFSQSLLNAGGMSDRLAPGTISSMAMSDEIVFRADFPDGNMPSVSGMYWRGGVLWQGDGLVWTQGRLVSREQRPAKLSGPSVWQRIWLQPHGEHWLFALDQPVSDVRGAYYLPGNVLQSRRAVTSRFRYEVVSRPENRETSLPADQRNEALRLPSHIAPRVRALVASWKAGGADPKSIIDTARHYFRREHFAYTLTPGKYSDEHGLEDFLFERRQGFCEHYAATFATLMRLAGIPSRIVIGYHGGEFNSMGKYLIVRQADSHAWCEVWLKDVGWLRVDPTEMIAPDRMSSSLASYLETQAAQTDPSAAQRSLTATGWHAMMHDMQLAWDSVNYQWDLRVLNFDEEAQRGFLFALGLGTTSWMEIAVWSLVFVATFLAALSLWMRRPPAAIDKISRGYARFCAALARAGLARNPTEGPRDFSTRAAERFPDQAALIERITALYVELRYGAGSTSPQPFLSAVRRLPRFTPPKRT
jgi:transglutaminase-like putative cysteine protease